jgi:replicative DNA helicase
MPATLISLRMISAVTNIPALDIEQGKITDSQFKTVQNAASTFNEIPLYIIDSTLSSDDMVAAATTVKEKRGLDFLVIDYLSLLTDRGDNEVQRLEGIVGRTRACATDLDIPILGVVQLNRDADLNEGNRPALRNIRYSDRISHDAFAAWMVHRPAYYMNAEERARYNESEDNAEIILDKNRQGPTGVIPMTFYPKQMRWESRFIHPVDPRPTGVN